MHSLLVAVQLSNTRHAAGASTLVDSCRKKTLALYPNRPCSTCKVVDDNIVRRKGYPCNDVSLRVTDRLLSINDRLWASY